MPDYSFETLNDKEFENLTRDILQRKLSINLETFKSGRDEGVDLRYSFSPINKLIVQAKHWRVSGIKKLIYELEKNERSKIEKLKPERYIISTSIPLSPSDKGRIQEAVSPFIKTSEDILGKEDLNNFLGLYPDIEKQHYKLWLSSVNILQTILNNAIKGRSDFVAEKIVEKASLFVPTGSYSKAIDIINKNHVLLVKGAPGVGKTTLAEYLIYKMLGDGFELVAVDSDIREAEDFYSKDGKQVFYFDDFLGSNYFELIHAKGSGSQISRFVERIKNDKNKRFILTTRTTILNQAKMQLHNLYRHGLDKAEYEVYVGDYSKLDKAKILYNHLYFSKIPSEYIDRIFENRNYMNIISHENYNPRIIEFITDPYRIESVSPGGYMSFVINNLDEPSGIWEGAYLNQIDDYARFILSTLFSIGMSARDGILKEAFESRLEYEIFKNGFKRVDNPFYSRIRLLLGGFLNHLKNDGDPGVYSFFNPSIADFLIGYLSRDVEEKWRILESSTFVQQFSQRFGIGPDSPIKFNRSETGRLLELLKARYLKLKSIDGSLVNLNLIVFMSKIYEWEEIKDICISLFKSLKIETMADIDFENAVSTIKFLSLHSEGMSVLSSVWDELIYAIFALADSEDEFLSIKKLFGICKINYSEWLFEEKNYQHVQECINDYWGSKIEDYVDEDLDLKSCYEEQEGHFILTNIRDRLSDFNNSLGVENSPDFDLDWIDLDGIIANNRRRAQEEDYEADQIDRASAGMDYDGEIHRLFSR